MRRSRAKSVRWSSLGVGLAFLLGFVGQNLKRVRLVADRAVSSLEFASSSIIISEKLAQLKDWVARKPLTVLLIAVLLCMLVLALPHARGAVTIPDEVSHFERILQFCRKCRKGTKIRIYVRIRQIAGELILPSESYFREMEELVRSKGLDVLYIFGIAPGDLIWLSFQSARAFFSHYLRFSKVRVLFFKDDVIRRNRLTYLDIVAVLLGDRSGLRHERDACGAYIKGRSLRDDALRVAQRRFERFRFASISVDEFLRLLFDDRTRDSIGAD
jgi:hypothetical protein